MKVLRAVLAGFLAWASTSAFAYTAAELLKSKAIHAAALSPSGRFIAVGIDNDVGITEAIAILDVQRPAEDRVVRRISLATPQGQRVVTGLVWASDAYLLSFMSHATKDPAPDPSLNAGLYSIHVGGDGAIKPYDALPKPIRIVAEGTPEAKYVYLTSGSSFAGMSGPRPYEIELATGSARLLATPDPVTQGWRVRDGRAVVKFNAGKSGEVANIFASLSEGDDWTLVNSLRYPEDRRNHLEVVAEAESPLEDYMRKTRSGADVDGIHLRDLRTRQLTSTLFELPGHDALSAQIRQRKFVSATYLDDTLKTQFANEALQQHYAALQKYFGADVSIEAILSSTLGGAWLLHVSGPRNAGEYHLYDPERRHVESIGAERPWLQSEELAPSTPLAVKARDGTALRAYLTCPNGETAGKRPLIVMPPNGPWAYAHLRFNSYVQAFAAQGWCVVEPNVRGTYGRGRAFQALGFGQWNGRVADDVADTIQALVRSGTVDPERVAGYGEYLGATMLMAAEVRQAGLLKAVVAYAPIVDGQHVISESKKFGRSPLDLEDWNRWLGELGKNSDLRKQLFQVRVPLYLVHPFMTTGIPLDDTKDLAKALEKAGLAPQVRYPGLDGKAPDPGQDSVHQLEEVLAFLRQHLGAG